MSSVVFNDGACECGVSDLRIETVETVVRSSAVADVMGDGQEGRSERGMRTSPFTSDTQRPHR